jgi:hypothetical protein
MYMSFKLWDEFKPCASATIQDCFHALPQNGEITHTWTYLNVVHTWTYLNVVMGFRGSFCEPHSI